MTPVSIMQDVWDSLGLHLNQKVLKLDKKRLSCGQFTNSRLRDSSEYHAGCIGFIRTSFEPKSSKIGQETAELWPIYQWQVANFSERHVGCMGSIWASFEPKRSQIG